MHGGDGLEPGSTSLKQARLEVARRCGWQHPGRSAGAMVGPRRREALADLVDEWLAGVWTAATPPPQGVALAAVGGHARKDAGPAGDLDLVLLHDGRALERPEVGLLADRLWYPVWDSGVRLDHSVRSVTECRRVAADDVTAAVAMLDLRPVAGDASLVLRAREALRADWRRGARSRLPELLITLTERAERHGELAHLVEPDLKEARGGLRDAVVLQAVVAGWLADVPHERVTPATRTLLDVRDALHAVTGRPGERLHLHDQDAVAEVLSLPDADALLAEVATAARALANAVDVTTRRARGAASRERRGRRRVVRAVDRDLVEHSGEVCLGSAARPQDDPTVALRAAAAAAREGLPLSPVTAAHLADACAPLPEPWSPAARAALVDLLGAGPALVGVWETLDQEGLVTGWLPELVPVRNRPQRTVVHRHTVDRHLVQTCVEAGRLLRQVARPDLLLLSSLLHDVGKLPGEADHASAGGPPARRAAVRVGLDADDADVVERMVREHLTLVELATRRDPQDPRTVETLLSAVDGREDLLDLLRALTEADARAAGPLAWTPWRQRLVDGLVHRARARLRGEAGAVTAGRGPAGTGTPASPPPGEAESLTPGERDVVEWVRTDGRPRFTVVEEGDDQSLLGVVAPDAPGVFAAVVGALAAHGLPVCSGQVMTVEGMAVARWWVTSPRGLPEPALLATTMRRLRSGDDTAVELVRRRERAWRPDGEVSEPHVVSVPGASADATVVEVRAGDRPGLLHRVGRAVAELGVDVRSVHAATFAGQADDVLYLRDREGRPLDPALTEAVVTALRTAAGAPLGELADVP